ncbi:glutathione S-transferase [Hesseltinella vesiculosa]|uniref:Glutathione S-transferase n=1 Tax=Hesseltinella vesiculosa TaxID=101127 RepID=A0A1X2GCP4_9FUNG|nr:glutathione S-transferase [Hesseltinella vesiculosa]
MMPQKLVLYNYKQSPYSHRALLALEALGATYENINVDIWDKPEWFAKDIYPEGKVPVLAVDGVHVPESLVIVELVDRLSGGNLVPADPIKLAQSRVAIEFFGPIPRLCMQLGTKQITAAEFFEQSETGFERLHELLLEQAENGPYFLGDQYSLADIAIAPLLARYLAFCKFILQGYSPASISKHPRLQQFVDGNLAHPAFQKTYIGDAAYAEYLQMVSAKMAAGPK